MQEARIRTTLSKTIDDRGNIPPEIEVKHLNDNSTVRITDIE